MDASVLLDGQAEELHPAGCILDGTPQDPRGSCKMALSALEFGARSTAPGPSRPCAELGPARTTTNSPVFCGNLPGHGPGGLLQP